MNGFGVIDISDKKNPVFVSQIYLGGGSGLYLKNNHAFIASGSMGL